MNFKTFLSALAVATTLIAPAFVFAQEVSVDTSVVTEATSATTPVVVTVDLNTQMQNDLRDLRAREADPSTGFVARFFIHLKIRELENKLNIATALQ